MKRLFNILAFTIALLVSGSPSVWAVDPALPLVFLNTTLVPPIGKTIAVAAGGDFQAALNTAQLGDVITLQAGATFTGPFALPNKTTGTGWIIVRSSTADANLPPPGTRIKPSYASVMPKIVSSSSEPALMTAPGAHHFRFIGIEFTAASGASIISDMIKLGDGSSAQTSLSQVPHDLIIDRCYIHGNPTLNAKRGIALNSTSTAIIDSYISDFHVVGQDTQAIAGWNGPGPFKIVNNYLEAAGENVLFGGATATIPNLVPSDIEIRRNSFYKPLSWKVGHPSYAGIHWQVKNLFELKNAQRVLIDGNTFTNNWADAQVGFAILFTVKGGGDGTDPWVTIQDVTFTNNIVRHTASAINTCAVCDISVVPGKRFKISNNLFDDVNGPKWGGGAGIFLQVLGELPDITVDHNTVFHTGNIISVDGGANTGFIYRNNITPHNAYGIIGAGTGVGNPTLSTYFPGAVFVKNVLAGPYPTAGGATISMYSNYPNNFFPSSLDAVGFADRLSLNYRLSPLSPYKNAATDGTDIGVNMDALNMAIAGGILNPTPPAPPTGLVVQ